MKEIKLTKGLSAIVDDEDYEYINQWKWTASRCRHNYYAIRAYKDGDKYVYVSMHRLITNNNSKLDTDHINGNTLDNRRCNLRICTHKQNARSHKRIINGKYRGVFYNKERLHYQSYINVDGKHIYLGKSDTAIEAAQKYNDGALKYFGEYAHINIPEPGAQMEIAL